jgi:hypothetical protein
MMTEEQSSSINDELIPATSLEVQHHNVTFPAHSEEAVNMILGMCNEVKDADWIVVSGVFPAHIAAALAKARVASASRSLQEEIYYSTGEMPKEFPYGVIVPVSVPAPALAGEVRGFVHSHWEWM